MFQVIFVTPGNKVYFSCQTKEQAINIIKSFEELVPEVTKEKDKILWSDDINKNHISMIRVSQVIGYYYYEEVENKLTVAQIKMLEKFTKTISKGDEWREDV